MLKLPTHSGFHDLFLNSPSHINILNNGRDDKLMIYLSLQMFDRAMFESQCYCHFLLGICHNIFCMQKLGLNGNEVCFLIIERMPVG